MWADPYGVPATPAGNSGQYWGQWDSHYGPMQRRPTSRRHQTDAMFGPTSGYSRPPAALLPQPAGGMAHFLNHPVALQQQAKFAMGGSNEKLQKNGQLYYDFNEGVNFTFKIKISGGPQGEIVLEYASWKTNASLDLEPGNYYKICVEAISSSGTVLAAGEIPFKSILCAAEMATLQMKAINFLQISHGPSQMQEIIIFYRNKPPEYWKKIQTNDSVMRPYLKDQCGNPGSPINGEIDGLFFAARLHNCLLPTSSPFGGQRLKLYCQKLFLPETHHMYFGDFYCNTYVHYVTIVICHKNSPVDQFCRERLDLLNPFDNMFLKLTVDNYGNYRYFINNNVWVEVYFTGDVPLWWGEFDYTVSLGQSKPNGIPNNKFCTVCNLYPLEAPPPVDQSTSGKSATNQKRTWEEIYAEKFAKKSRINWIDIELAVDQCWTTSSDASASSGGIASTSTFHSAMQSARQLSAESNGELDELLPHVIDVTCHLVDFLAANDSPTQKLPDDSSNVVKFSFPPPNPHLLNPRDEEALIERVLVSYGSDESYSENSDDFKPANQSAPTKVWLWNSNRKTQPLPDLVALNFRASEIESKAKKMNDNLHHLKIVVRNLEKKLTSFR